MLERNKFYLTKQGLENLKEEYRKLLQLRRFKAEKGAPAILNSEELNTEFIAYREDMEILESRLSELEYVLKNFEIIKPPAKNERERINLGAKVTVEVDGQEDEFHIVGTLEANPSLGRISNESPVGAALMGQKVGAEVYINSPIRTVYKIKAIKY